MYLSDREFYETFRKTAVDSGQVLPYTTKQMWQMEVSKKWRVSLWMAYHEYPYIEQFESHSEALEYYNALDAKEE